jgi:pyridoxal phosphate enzyme (YggS family)
MNIADRVNMVKDQLARAAESSGRTPESIQLVAVSKYQPAERVLEAYNAGCRQFGENYVQEAANKRALLGQMSDATWHLIGGLQSNKSALAVQTFDIVQTLDRPKLANALADAAKGQGKVLQVVLQVDLTGAAGRSGCAPADIPKLAEQVTQLPGLQLRGLMAMAPLGIGDIETRKAFASVRKLYDALPVQCQGILSMGMSGDYPLAIAEGATVVRVGTAIFGERPMVS